jgi:hypothetical protein
MLVTLVGNGPLVSMVCASMLIILTLLTGANLLKEILTVRTLHKEQTSNQNTFMITFLFVVGKLEKLHSNIKGGWVKNLQISIL